MKKRVRIYRDVVVDGEDMPAEIEIRKTRGCMTLVVSIMHFMEISPDQTSREIFQEFQDATGIEIIFDEEEDSAQAYSPLDEWLAAQAEPDDAA